MRRDINRLVAAESDRIGHLSARLATLGPAATLARGYAVVESLEDRANHAALQVENDMGFDVAPVEDDPTLVWVSKRLR